MLYYKFEEGDTNVNRGLKTIKKKFHVVLRELRQRKHYERKAETRRKEVLKAQYKNKKEHQERD